MNDIEVIKFFFGILFIQIIVKIFKKIIKQSRPIASKTYGMPSSRSAVMTFIVLYLILTNKFTMKTKLLISLFVLCSLTMKFVIKEHSLLQLFCGSIIGIILAIIFSNININNYINPFILRPSPSQ